MYIVERELRDQFQSIEATIQYIWEQKEKIQAFFQGVKSLCVCGCGSSFYVAKSTAMQFSQRAGIPAFAIPAGDLLVNFNAYEKMLENTALILLSRSGSTTELHMTAKHCRSTWPAIKMLSVCAVKDSLVSHLADVSLEIPWAFDEAVCQTRTVSNLYVSGLMLCALKEEDWQLVKELQDIRQKADSFVREVEERMEETGGQDFTSAVVLADSSMAGLAEEGALAFKEICRCPSNFFHVLDVRHGPTVTIDKETLVLLLSSRGNVELQEQLAADMRKRTNMVLTLDCAGEAAKSGGAGAVRLPRTSCDDVSAVFMIYCIQLICLKHALHKGVNPDEPEGLDPWIELKV